MKVRETGKIALSKDGGGSLKFLGRMISRQSGSPTLVMHCKVPALESPRANFGCRSQDFHRKTRKGTDATSVEREDAFQGIVRL